MRGRESPLRTGQRYLICSTTAIKAASNQEQDSVSISAKWLWRPMPERHGLKTEPIEEQHFLSRCRWCGGKKMPIRILIADDQRLFRQSLKYLLEQEEDMKVVGEVGDGQDAFTLAQESHPDIILMDVDMPKLDGVTATRLILERKPSIKVLMLSVHDKDERMFASIRIVGCAYNFEDANHKEFIRI